MSSGIYQIRNLINGKVYVGSAEDFFKRWREHRTLLRSNRLKHHSPHFQNAWDKYGEEAFVFEILIHCEKRFILCYEQKYMDFFCSADPEFGYNICSMAGSQLGMKHSEETKKKMSVSHIGKKLSADHCRKISECERGENGSAAKLTWLLVREIRERYSSQECSQRHLAKEYGVRQRTIACVVHNITWIDESLDSDYFKRVSVMAEKMLENNRIRSTKLSWSQVVEIKKKYAAGNDSSAALGKEYGVSGSMILHIVNNKRRKEEK